MQVNRSSRFVITNWFVAQLAELPAFNRKGAGSNPAGPTVLLMPDGVTGNIREFDSCVTGSNPVPVTDVVFSLFGKVPSCDGGEQGSIPGDNQRNVECKMQNEKCKKAAFIIGYSLFTGFTGLSFNGSGYCATNAEMKVRLLLSQPAGVVGKRYFGGLRVDGSSPS